MRIRKRKMLYPQSSLSPSPALTDQPVQQGNKTAHFHFQPSDHKDDCFLMMNEAVEKEGEQGSKSHHTGKTSISTGAETVTEIKPESSDSYQLGKRSESHEDKIKIKDKVNSLMSQRKTKIKKKRVQVQPSDDKAQEQEGETKDSNMKGGAKKRGRGNNVLMEGSRCSRVNGRGWRCSQPTLVGYSLCEHHLGKGRLRSIKGKLLIGSSTTTTNTTAHKEQESETLSMPMKDKKPKQDNGYGDMDALLVTKKRMKLGVVKARSLSSLLGQTDNAVEGDNTTSAN